MTTEYTAQSNSSLLTRAAAGAGILFLLSGTPSPINSYYALPRIEQTRLAENMSGGSCYMCGGKKYTIDLDNHVILLDRYNYEPEEPNFVEEAMSLFPGIRGFTKEEALLNEEYLNSLFRPTGKSFFDV